MKVWIDLANSPHPLLFAPIVRRLEEEGHTVSITARDHAQTAPLALERWPEAEIVGARSPAGRVAKARTLAGRAWALRAWGRRQRPDLAVSHNSYAQIIAARALGLPVLTAMDFEFQPANHLAFRLAERVLLPEAIPERVVRRQGARADKVRRYPGAKESVELGDFAPRPEVVSELGLDREPDAPLVVMRAPPTGAIYHGLDNPLFVDCLLAIARQGDVRCVALPRHPEQARALEALGLPNCVVPRAPVDARSLIYAADLVIGAGGTMTREAALTGVPTYSIFAGKVPAVERWLEGRGLLRRLADARELDAVRTRPTPPRPLEELRAEGRATTERFVEAMIEQ